jgi:proteasome lid subunit RPN8/RPN11
MTQYRLSLSEPLYDELRAHLLRGGNEEVAFLFAHEVHLPDATRLIVHRWEPVPPEMLLLQREDVFVMDSGFIVRRVKVARDQGESVLLAHSHPTDLTVPRFSRADDYGEKHLYPLLHVRLPDRTHGAIVMSPAGCAARLSLPGGQHVAVDELQIIGRRVQRFFTSSRREEPIADTVHARQQLIWGAHGQGMLRNTTVGVIGAGGTGSVVAQQLIHLGVGRLIVVDRQLVEESNLPRIVGALRDDINVTTKVDVVRRIAQGVDPSINVQAIHGDVTQPEVLARLREADLLFLCTDQHYSRMVVNALAVQYMIPLVDLGFLINVEPISRYVIAAVGEVRIVVPGGYCLSCAGILNAERIKAEKASPEEVAAFPAYFTGLDVPDPSVITLNSTIASLAVSVGCDMLVPTMRSVTALDSYRYNAIKGIVTPVVKEHHPECGMCGLEGRTAMGDDLTLPQ